MVIKGSINSCGDETVEILVVMLYYNILYIVQNVTIRGN